MRNTMRPISPTGKNAIKKGSASVPGVSPKKVVIKKGSASYESRVIKPSGGTPK